MLQKAKTFGLCICLLCLCACSAKQESTSAVSEGTDSVTRESVLEAAELAPIQEQRKGLIFSDPEKTLTTVDNLLKSGATPALLASRGLLLSQLDRKDEAFESLTQAVQLHASAEMYALRAFILWRSGHLRGAFRDAEYALYKEKNQPMGLMSMGLVKLAEAQEEASEGGKTPNVDDGCMLLHQACEGGQCFGLEEVQKQGMCLK